MNVATTSKGLSPRRDRAGSAEPVFPKNASYQDLGELAPAFDAVVDVLQRALANPKGLGRFPKNELDAGFTCACRHLNTSRPVKALQVLGALIVIEPRNAHFWLAAGVGMQQLKRYADADSYYAAALEYDPESPMAHMYRGEVQVLSGNVESGLGMLRRGVELAADAHLLRPYVNRAHRMIKLIQENA